MPVTTSGAQTAIEVSTSTQIDDVEWTADEYVGRVQLGTNWVNLVAYSVSPKIAIIDGYDISSSPIGLVTEDNSLFISANGSQTISAIDIYAESTQAT